VDGSVRRRFGSSHGRNEVWRHGGGAYVDARVGAYSPMLTWRSEMQGKL
jgi:hypothetical protein